MDEQVDVLGAGARWRRARPRSAAGHRSSRRSRRSAPCGRTTLLISGRPTAPVLARSSPPTWTISALPGLKPSARSYVADRDPASPPIDRHRLGGQIDAQPGRRRVVDLRVQVARERQQARLRPVRLTVGRRLRRGGAPGADQRDGYGANGCQWQPDPPDHALSPRCASAALGDYKLGDVDRDRWTVVTVCATIG